MKDFFDPMTAPIVASAMTISFGMVTIYFKWLTGSFKRLEIAVNKLSETTNGLLDSHEDLDQFRHEQNLLRFEKISVALARLGSDNGTHSLKEHK